MEEKQPKHRVFLKRVMWAVLIVIGLLYVLIALSMSHNDPGGLLVWFAIPVAFVAIIGLISPTDGSFLDTRQKALYLLYASILVISAGVFISVGTVMVGETLMKWAVALTLIVSLLSLVFPLPKKVRVMSWVIIVGCIISVPTWIIVNDQMQAKQGKERLADLRATNFDEYLSELRSADHAQWMEEIKSRDPELYAKEKTRLDEQEKQRNARAELEEKVKRLEQAKRRLRLKCEEIVKTSSKFPTKADFSFLEHNVVETSSRVQVVGRVELMNGFGAMIPHMYECIFVPNKDGVSFDLGDFNLVQG